MPKQWRRNASRRIVYKQCRLSIRINMEYQQCGRAIPIRISCTWFLPRPDLERRQRWGRQNKKNVNARNFEPRLSGLPLRGKLFNASPPACCQLGRLPSSSHQSAKFLKTSCKKGENRRPMIGPTRLVYNRTRNLYKHHHPPLKR